jgi:Putative peptidoglycan binding domain
MFNRRSKLKLMKIFRFPACLIAALTICIHSVAGQTNVPGGQNTTGVVTNNGARAGNVRPNGPTSQNVGRGAVGTNGRTAYLRPTQTVVQRPVNSRSNYSALARPRPLNPTLAAMSARQSGRTYNVQPAADLLARNDVVQGTLSMTDVQPIAKPDDLQTTRKIPAREEITPRELAAPSVRPGSKVLQPPSDEVPLRETLQSKPRHKSHGNQQHRSFSDAFRCHRHEWHDRNWWKRNCNTIVFVNSGYYFLDAGYWYPAWGYDPLNSYYDYDGPIYTYGNLLPDQVIANVQEALQEAGYYFGPITGSLSVETRAALANFQRDYGLPVTGAIDQPTIETLGLY